MALYVSAGRRRRRLVGAAAGALLAGLLLGGLVGRFSAPTAADGAAEAKRSAAQASGLLDALPFHYEQMMAGELDPVSFQASLDDGIERASAQLDRAVATAPWLDPGAVDALRRKVVGLRALVERKASPAEFRTAVHEAVTDLDQRFGKASGQ